MTYICNIYTLLYMFVNGSKCVEIVCLATDCVVVSDTSVTPVITKVSKKKTFSFRRKSHISTPTSVKSASDKKSCVLM